MAGSSKVTLCFLHGVSSGRPAEDSQWAEVLAESIASIGQPRPADRAVTIKTLRYRSALAKGAGESKSIPPVVPGGADEDPAVFIHRRERVRNWLEPYAAAHPRRGWGDTPDSLADLAVRAAQLFRLLREQVYAYSKNAQVRAAVLSSVLRQMPKSGRVVLVAHSLGSVVALDLIPRLPKGIEVSLVTIGSPLPLREPWNHLDFSGDRFPRDRMRSWVNVLDTTDPVTLGRPLSSRFPEALDSTVSFGSMSDLLSSHASLYYLSLPVVGAAVAEALYDITTPVETKESVSRTKIGALWDLSFLAAAYAAQISRSCDAKKHKWKRRFDGARRVSVERVVAQARAEYSHLPPGTGAVPEAGDFLDHAAGHVRGRWSDEQLVPLSIGLLMASPVRPFDVSVAPEHQHQALERLVNRVRRADSNISDQEFATKVVRSLKQVTEDLGASRPGRGLGPALLIGGAIVLAATGVGLAAAAPVGLAGAAALTSMLAAFGPGGMVGGMVTIAMASSVGSALIAAGFSGDGAPPAPRQREAMQFVNDAAQLRPEQLQASIVGWLSVVHAQDQLGLATWAEQIRALLLSVLTEVTNEWQTHQSLGSLGAAEWKSKHDCVEKALEWLQRRFAAPGVGETWTALRHDRGEITVDKAAIERRLLAEGDDRTPRSLEARESSGDSAEDIDAG